MFRGGASPKLEPIGGRLVSGDLDLEIRFEGVNPLCYRYSVEGERPAVGPAAAHTPLPARGDIEAEVSPPSLSSAKLALRDLVAAGEELERTMADARSKASLNDVWRGCRTGSDPSAQRSRVEAASKAVAAGVGKNGAWRTAIVKAMSMARAGRRLARELGGTIGDANEQVEQARRDLKSARDRDEKAATALLQATKHGRKPPTGVTKEADAAAASLDAAEAKLRDAEDRLADVRRARDIGRRSRELGRTSRKAMRRMARLVRDVNRANSLLAKAPTTVHRRVEAGEDVNVVVRRTRLRRGFRAPAPVEVHHVHAFETLHPILVDIGVGPALGLGENTAEYGLAFGPRHADDNIADVRVHREEQGLDLDGMVSISAYIWGRRYLDDRVFEPEFLIPRPMVGISLTDPTDAIYTGLSIDPIQFVDISFGVRWKNTEELVGPQVGDPALRDVDGQPVQPITREEVQPRGFVAITFSTDLVHRWIDRGIF